MEWAGLRSLEEGSGDAEGGFRLRRRKKKLEVVSWGGCGGQ